MKSKIKKILPTIIYTILILSLLVFGCYFLNDMFTLSQQPIHAQPQPQPHLYWKDIDVTVTNVDVHHYLILTRSNWDVELEVYSPEYDISGSVTIHGEGFGGYPKQADYQEGDVVQAELYSWVDDTTGNVIRREINTVY